MCFLASRPLRRVLRHLRYCGRVAAVALYRTLRRSSAQPAATHNFNTYAVASFCMITPRFRLRQHGTLCRRLKTGDCVCPKFIGHTQSPHLERILPAAAWYFPSSVSGFSALSAEKPDTNKSQEPLCRRLKTGDCVCP